MKVEDHVKYLDEAFRILKRYRIRLNPFKSDFGVSSGIFLGYTINQNFIEFNTEMINALIATRLSQKLEVIQCLTGRIVALSCFISLKSLHLKGKK